MITTKLAALLLEPNFVRLAGNLKALGVELNLQELEQLKDDYMAAWQDGSITVAQPAPKEGE